MAENMDLKENIPEQGEKGIAMELFSILKKIILIQWIIIGILIALNAAQGIYHDYKWSQFDTISVDGGDGGNAGYVGNDGDVNNYGEGGSTQKEK